MSEPERRQWRLGATAQASRFDSVGGVYLAASVHVEQAHPAGQLLGVLDAVPQDAGGEIQGALVRLRTQE